MQCMIIAMLSILYEDSYLLVKGLLWVALAGNMLQSLVMDIFGDVERPKTAY